MKRAGIFLLIWLCCGTENLCALPDEQTGVHLSLTHSVQNTLFHHFTDTTSAVSVRAGVPEILLNEVQFDSNAGRGLLLEPRAQVAELTNAQFTQNSAGGMIVHNRAVLQKMNHILFEQNQANNGAGMYWFEGAVTPAEWKHLYFLQNYADEKGGGLYVGRSSFDLQDSSFEANQAQYGGAIYASGPLNLTGQQLIFKNNSGFQGGAIYAADSFSLTGGNLLFAGNRSTAGGSAIYARGEVFLSAIGGDIVFQNNEHTAVFMENERAQLILRPTSSGNILFDDLLGAAGTLQLAVQGEGGGQVVFNQPLSNASISLQSGSLVLNPDYPWQDILLAAQGGELNTADDQISQLHIGMLDLQKDLHLRPEVDLQQGKMDSFAFDQVTGNGSIRVEDFLLKGAQAEQGKTLPFIRTDSPLNVIVPQTAYNQLYAYDTSYNSATGQIYFTLREDWNNAHSFNPNVFMQPAAAYGSLMNQLEIPVDVLAAQRSRFLRYDDTAASFYVQSFYNTGEISFSNDLNLKRTKNGFSAGWYSQDLGWFSEAAAVLGLHAGMANASFQYLQKQWQDSSFFAGASLHIYQGGFFGIGGVFAGQNKQELTSWQADQTTAFASTGLLAGYHLSLDDGTWFLNPYVSLGYAWQGKGKERLYNGVMLTALDTAAGSVKGGMRLLKSYNDQWHWQAGACVNKYILSEGSFQANQQQLPVFESGLIYEINLGFATEGSTRLGIDGEGFFRFGAEQSVGGRITVAFG